MTPPVPPRTTASPPLRKTLALFSEPTPSSTLAPLMFLPTPPMATPPATLWLDRATSTPPARHPPSTTTIATVSATTTPSWHLRPRPPPPSPPWPPPRCLWVTRPTARPRTPSGTPPAAWAPSRAPPSSASCWAPSPPWCPSGPKVPLA